MHFWCSADGSSTHCFTLDSRDPPSIVKAFLGRFSAGPTLTCDLKWTRLMDWLGQALHSIRGASVIWAWIRVHARCPIPRICIYNSAPARCLDRLHGHCMLDWKMSLRNCKAGFSVRDILDLPETSDEGSVTEDTEDEADEGLSGKQQHASSTDALWPGSPCGHTYPSTCM